MLFPSQSSVMGLRECQYCVGNLIDNFVISNNGFIALAQK